MTGAFLSTQNGPKDPVAGWGADVLPAISCTVTGGMLAVFVSVFGGTFVGIVLNEEDPTSPEPPALSLAVHGTTTSVDSHTGAGGVQMRVGGVRSTLNVKVGDAELKTFPLYVTTVSTV